MGKGKSDFTGGGDPGSNYAVEPAPLAPGKFHVVDTTTRDAVSGPHSKDVAQGIADKHQSTPNPMRDEANYGRADPNKGLGVTNTGKGPSSDYTPNVSDGNWEPTDH